MGSIMEEQQQDEVKEELKKRIADLRLGDSWLERKTDRQRRMVELREYLDQYLPEVQACGDMKRFIDIGPGPGELLELAQAHGMWAIGYDAVEPEGGMGSKYLEVSRLSHQLRDLNIEYCEPELTAETVFTQNNGSAYVINMRGSIEQVLCHLMEGEPHHVHQDCNRLSWKTNEAAEGILQFLRLMKKCLSSSGRLMIAANGAANTSWYDQLLMTHYESVGFSRVKRFDERTHKLYV